MLSVLLNRSFPSFVPERKEEAEAAESEYTALKDWQDVSVRFPVQDCWFEAVAFAVWNFVTLAFIYHHPHHAVISDNDPTRKGQDLAQSVEHQRLIYISCFCLGFLARLKRKDQWFSTGRNFKSKGRKYSQGRNWGHKSWYHVKWENQNGERNWGNLGLWEPLILSKKSRVK